MLVDDLSTLVRSLFPGQEGRDTPTLVLFQGVRTMSQQHAESANRKRVMVGSLSFLGGTAIYRARG